MLTASTTRIPFSKMPRETVKYALYGCLGEVGRRLRPPSIPIITYHSVDELDSTISVSEAAFRRQMTYLHQHGFRSLNLSELITAWESGLPLPERSFVLTFDDGFRSVYEIAFPLLQQLEFTATIFPVTGFIGTRCGWEMGVRDLEVGADRLEVMTWPQIQEMRRHGFEFGAHGDRHLELDQHPDEVVRQDIVRSRQQLEDRLGCRCRTFCYPYGQFTEDTRRIVADAGFRAAVTTQFGWNDQKTDRFSLKRVGSARFTNLQILKASLYQMYGWHLRRPHGRP